MLTRREDPLQLHPILASQTEYKLVTQTIFHGDPLDPKGKPQHVFFELKDGNYLRISDILDRNYHKLPNKDAPAFSTPVQPKIYIRIEVNGHTNFNNVLIA